MTRRIIVGSTLLVASLAAQAAPEQFREKVERNARVLETIADCTEGFAEAVEGSTLTYASFRPTPQQALITRTTTGAMRIAWKTRPVPAALPDNEANFVVMAGMYGQEPTGFRFQMFINGVPRFAFATTVKESWEAAGTGGGTLRFAGVQRDKFGDLFGCLRITLPAEWVRCGEPVEIALVGENAGQAAWVMVFEAPDVVAYQRALVRNETYCEMTVRTAGQDRTAEFRGPSGWQGKEVSLSSGAGKAAAGRFSLRDGSSYAELTLPAAALVPPLALTVDGELLARLDTLFAPASTTLMYPPKVVSLSAAEPDSTGWRVSVESSYQPDLGASLEALSRISAGLGTQHLIVSTHQDIAWMDSPENCVRDRDEKIITPLLGIMRSDSAYHFDLEDVLCLREYLGRHPDRKEEIRRFMAEGRLGVGASFTQPYEELCSGEMLVRQFYAGKRWLRAEFPGCDTKTYWNMDVPGRSLQMAQVMRKAGVEYLVMSRFAKGLYSWYSPDGSAVTAFSPGHYGDFKARVEGAGFEQAAGFVASTAVDWLEATHSLSRDLPLVSMSDMSGPDRYDTFLAKWSRLRTIGNADGTASPLSLPPVRYSGIQEYLDSVSSLRAELPAVRGERPDIWLYIHGPTHHLAISAKREADFLLPAAETFSTVDALLRRSFARYPQEELTRAWEAQIYPDHGWGGKNGEITDSTFRAKYEFARETGKRLLNASLTSIAARIRTGRDSGEPLVVFNSVSWSRSGPVEAFVKPAAGAARGGLVLSDSRGVTVPAQVEVTKRHSDGSIAAARLLFIARDVPSVGYRTYYMNPSRTRQPRRAEPGAEVTSLESQFYRLEMGAGGVRQIFDKELNEPLLDTSKFLGGELFTMQSVGEDAGEWDAPQQPTMEGFDRLRNHPASWRSVESGSVRDVIEARYVLSHATVVQRIALYRAIKRVDFDVSLVGWDGTRYREFRLAFPIQADGGEVAYQVPFGVLEVGKGEMKGAPGERYKQEAPGIRPRGIQDWIGLYGPRFGVTLSSSVSVWDYRDPTDSTAERILLQPVLLASRRSCHSEGPWYLQKGDHHYHFSLTSHAPGWREGQRRGIEANAPLLAVVSASKGLRRELPVSGSFLALDAPNVVLSTMKKAEDDESVIVRVYDAEGKASTASLDFLTRVESAREASILEDAGGEIRARGKKVALQVGSYAIETVKIKPVW